MQTRSSPEHNTTSLYILHECLHGYWGTGLFGTVRLAHTRHISPESNERKSDTSIDTTRITHDCWIGEIPECGRCWRAALLPSAVRAVTYTVKSATPSFNTITITECSPYCLWRRLGPLSSRLRTYQTSSRFQLPESWKTLNSGA